MSLLNTEHIQNARSFIFKNGRLLERKLFEYFFENGTKQACLKALFAYQNEDGGFGNGIEPDLLCPDSTAIGAETALYVLELLDCHNAETIGGLVDWIVTHQNSEGFINHPPANMFNYPYQPWWKNPDRERILALAGILKKWGVGEAAFFEKVRSFFMSVSVPEEVSFYDYPYFAYLKHCSESNEDRAQFSKMVEGLPTLLSKYRNQFPLFSRAWFYASDCVESKVLANEAAVFVKAFHKDGDIDSPYPDHPWWRPIILLDGLIVLKKIDFL